MTFIFYILYSSPSNKAVDKYRSAKDGKIATINFPAMSGRAATSKAADKAAPEEIPTANPSN
ncbi:hypothetical protein CCP2SC5_680001 [Azospirillaceae bacterium]